MSRPLQTNTSDRQQVKRAGRVEQRRHERILNSVRETMQSPASRLLFWHLLDEFSVYHSVFDHSGSIMYFNEGQRNAGLRIRALLLEADEAAYELMEREARERAKRDDRELEAAATPSSTQGESDHG